MNIINGLYSNGSEASSEAHVSDLAEADTSHVESVVQRIFQAVISDEAAPISNVAINSTKAASNTYSLFGAIFGTPSEVSEDAPNNTSLGVAAATLTMFDGAISAYKAWRGKLTAYRVGDKNGIVEGNVLLTRSFLQVMRGVTYAVARPLANAAGLFQASVSATSSSLIGRAAYWIGTAAVVLSVVYFALKSLTHSLKVHNRRHLLSKVNNNPDKIQYLKGRLGLEIEHTKRYQEFLALSDEDKIKFLVNEGIKRIKLHKEKYKEIKEIKEIIENTSEFSEETLQAISKFLLKTLEKDATKSEQFISLYKAIILEKKTYKMERILGKDAVKELKAQLNSEIDEASIVSQLKAVIKKSNIDDALRATLFAVIAAAFIASLIFTGPGGALAISLLFIATGLIVLGLDGYDFYKDYKSGKTGQYDTLVSKLGLAAGVVAITASVVAMAILGFNPLALSMTVVVGVVWLTVHGVMIAMARRNRLKQEAKEAATLQKTASIEALSDTKKIWESFLPAYI